jgi:RNA polymerase primary sigma factor
MSASNPSAGAAAEPFELPSAFRSHALLTPDEEISLAKAAQSGDARARRRLIEANLRLVISISRRYRGLGLGPEDLVQEGIIGLVRAAERFDWRLGYRFSTYATWWIRQAMQRALANDGRAIRLPLHIGERRRLLERLRSELRARLGREPTVEELAAEAGLTPRKVELALEVPDTTSLEAVLSPRDDAPWLETLPDEHAVDPELIVERTQERLRVRTAVAALPPRERTTIVLHFGLDGQPCTLKEVAASLGVTRERARKIEEHALSRLATSLGAPERKHRAAAGRTPAAAGSL